MDVSEVHNVSTFRDVVLSYGSVGSVIFDDGSNMFPQNVDNPPLLHNLQKT